MGFSYSAKLFGGTGSGSSLPTLTGNTGKVLTVNAGETGTEWAAGPAPAAAGSNTQLLFNDSDAIAGTNGATWTKASKALGLEGPLTLTPTADVVPLTARAYSSGTNHIVQWQTSANGALGHIAHDGSITAPAVSATTFTGALTGNASTASDGLTSASGTAPLTLTLAAKALTGSVATMTAASAGAGGAAGLVPASSAGDQAKFLRADATWQTVSGGGGVTNSAGANVLAKSDGTNLVASTVSDDGTLVTINTATKARATILTDGTGPALGVTGTLPASPSARVNGLAIAATSSGTAAYKQVAARVSLAAGYTGTGASPVGLEVQNTVASAGNYAGSYVESITSPIAIYANCEASADGTRNGVVGRGVATKNDAKACAVGVKGYSAVTNTGAISIGVHGNAKGAIGISIGGFFSLQDDSDGNFQNSTFTGAKAALVADNVGQAAPIFLARDNGTIVFSVNDGGGVNLMREVEANTAGVGTPNALIATESHKVLTNQGSTAKNYHTLPAAATGLTYTFYVQDADGIRVVAGTGDTIRFAATASSSGGYIESVTIGDSITLVAINADEWVAVAVVGTGWTAA